MLSINSCSCYDARPHSRIRAFFLTTLGLPPTPNRIAVLPFENLREEKGNAYFAEGVQDEILTGWRKLPIWKSSHARPLSISKARLTIFRRSPGNSAWRTSLRAACKKSDDQVRVNVQLINAMTDAHLWADIYDRKSTDLFAVESDIAKSVADTLQAKLSGSEQKANRGIRAGDPIKPE